MRHISRISIESEGMKRTSRRLRGRFSPCLILGTAVACLMLAGSAFAQESAADADAETQGEEDPVNAIASRLEAELGKYKETSPEAADVMVQLVDLYYEHGRVFGLTRVAQRFVAVHSPDERHKEVMLKLIDGLEATSRNTDHASYCRQFLQRYPEAAEAADIELRLAATLDESTDYAAAADAHRAIWRRHGADDVGTRHAVRAVELYAIVNSKPVFTQSAELAAELVEKLPDGPLPRVMVQQSMTQWNRGNEWARSNAVGAVALSRGLQLTPEQQRWVHYTTGENFGRQSQWANAVESFRKARAVEDEIDVHQRLIVALSNDATSTPADMAPLVEEFTLKYPDRTERFAMQAALAMKYRAAGDAVQARAAFGRLLEFDAVSGSNAYYYVEQTPNEPAENMAAAAALAAAVERNPNPSDKAYLRYVLAFNVHRDRLEDVPAARAVLRQLVSETPTDNSYTQQAVAYLLTSAESDQQFQQDVMLVVQMIRANLHLSSLRGTLEAWAKSAAGNEETKARAEIAQRQAEQLAADPFVQAWVAAEQPRAEGQPARDQLIKTGKVAEMNDAMARVLLERNAYYLRNYTPSEQRPESVPAYGLLVRRFPEDVDAAINWLSAATDYGPPELAREAAVHLIGLEPTSNNADVLRRLMLAATQSTDADLARQALTWIQSAEETFGPSLTYAYYIGDLLVNLELTAEAEAYWRSHLDVDPNHNDSRLCAERLLRRMDDPAAQQAFLAERLQIDSDYHGWYATQLADLALKAGDLDQFESILTTSRARQAGRPLQPWGVEEQPARSWVEQYRADEEAADDVKSRIFAAVRDMEIGRPSAMATLSLMDLNQNPEATAPVDRLRQLAAVTRMVDNSTYDWDTLVPYLQARLAENDYLSAATLASGMLANIPNINDSRRDAGRAIVAQSYSRLGAVGLTIDEDSPVAPLLQAALYLRLGDRDMALDGYVENKTLFDEHRDEVPVDLLLFVCDSLIAAGGDENHEYVEDVLRGWMIKHSENPQFDDATKANVQLLLAKNFDRARRYDIARSEYTSVLNRFPDTPQAIEAEFGIGEAFMAQKVYDQAEAVFEKLAGSRESDIVVRAEFLRGVVAYRRGDKDESREIFRNVLERVPNIELANQALFNLAEVYGDEERYIDQLNLLRTVGRLGRNSKRTHSPGTPLSIVVQDSDLGISRGHSRIPVIVTTEPGGDREQIYLTSGGAGKGLFRADLETQLGQVTAGDGVLQLSGEDIVRSDYADDFKLEFKSVPLSDVEIRVASDGRLRIASSRIIDEKEETFSERLEREARERERNRRYSDVRPASQIKPGNPIYVRVDDPDRDLSDAADGIVVKFDAESGDSVQVTLEETGSHTGIFEGTVPTAELPAGALASDTAIEHSPVMAIDQDPETFWMSEPDGASPKWLSVDMKDLKVVSRVRIASPNADRHTPVRGELYGSHDGQFWFRIASNPPVEQPEASVDEFGRMKQRVFEGNYNNLSQWNQVLSVSRNATPLEETEVDTLEWQTLPPDGETTAGPYAVLWDGKLVQERDGAARILIRGVRSALWIDGRLELPVGAGNRSVDLWLERGSHDLTIFASTTDGAQGVSANIARADPDAGRVTLLPFRAADFEIEGDRVRPALPREDALADFAPNEWTFAFEPLELRHIKFQVDEYVGEAVAISTIEITGEEPGDVHIPSEADLLTLATNNVLELAGGDVVTGSYSDEFTHRDDAGSRLLSERLTATYYNAAVAAIDYDFERQRNGNVVEIPKRIMRIDPGKRFVVEIIDYDLDQTAGQDTAKFDVIVNDGEPVELTATETEGYTGRFRKEIDTSAEAEDGKFQVQPGDRIYVRYIDSQNTFPGHAVPRESVVFVNTPSAGKVRILETRVIPGDERRGIPSRFTYQPAAADQPVSHVAFEAPLTVEVIDPDAARDSRSEVTVTLSTPEGATVDVHCELSGAFSGSSRQLPRDVADVIALEEGRFIGQVIMQLGGKDSPQLVPVTAEMPRDLIGRTVDESDSDIGNVNLVTRVLNLTGKDAIVASYRDEARLPGGPPLLEARGRLISTGELRCTDRDYDLDVAELHVGEKIFLMVTDPDQDQSDERDSVQVEITTEFGEHEVVELYETLAHTGIFTGSLTLKSSGEPTPDNLKPDDPFLECYFGDTIRASYTDPAASTEEGTATLERQIPVVIGTDGLVAAFSKTFNDENLAVETKFTIAESYFELFKSHKELGRDTDQQADLEAGRRVLREVMEDYPDPKYVPRIAYLLGQFAQELEDWDEAVSAYQLIIDQFPEHSLAPDAQYKLAQSYEERGDFDEALEAYVTLAATYPKSPLIASVMIRICDHFYKAEEYSISAQVGEKFLERFESHQHASRIAFRIGQCFYKAEEFTTAGTAFDRFAKDFPEDQLAPDSLFWAGESYRMGGNNSEAFRRYNRCRWDFPASEAAKYARGRLALPEMLQQFESEANSIENQ